MDNSNHFKIAFDGKSLRNNTIDARDLAVSIVALGDLVEETAKNVGLGDSKVRLRVRADLHPGSFEIGFELFSGKITDVLNMFSGDRYAGLANILQILGFLGGGTVGVVQFILWLKRRSIKETVILENLADGSQKIEIHVEGGEKIEISKGVVDLWNNSRIQKATHKFVKPLSEEGVDSLKISYGNNEPVIIEKQDVDYFVPIESDELRTETSSAPGFSWTH